MSLSSSQLDAFMAVAKTKHFSKAADTLFITQSALSQRIAGLEAHLEVTLFIRDPAGVRLTEDGDMLLRYCQQKGHLEDELLATIKPQKQGLFTGTIRAAAFSSIARSIVLPVIAKVVRSQSTLKIELMSKELQELPELLTSGVTDFIFINSAWKQQGYVSHLLGYEEYVLIKPAKKSFPENVFLDHDQADMTTDEFFSQQHFRPLTWRRHYLDDIDLIIAGVQEGLGCAVVPTHLIKGTKGIKVIADYDILKIPVYVVYHKQAYYTRLQRLLIEHFQKSIPPYLKCD